MHQFLLTGATGKLGGRILKLLPSENVVSPTRQEMDLTKPETITPVLSNPSISTVIHCAALARIKACHANPAAAVEANILGTSHMVKAILGEASNGHYIRMIHISTDGVYQSTDGDYSEKSQTLPTTTYGWTKLGAESAVRCLPDYCIIRTRFYDPEHIPFDRSAVDIFTNSMPVDELAAAVLHLTRSKFIGVVNVGGARMSDYDRYRQHKPTLQACTKEDIVREVGFPMATDASMDCSVWKKWLEQERI